MKRLHKTFAFLGPVLCAVLLAFTVTVGAVEGDVSHGGSSSGSGNPSEIGSSSSADTPNESETGSNLSSTEGQSFSKTSSQSVSSINGQTTVSQASSSKRSSTGTVTSQSAASQKSNTGGTISDSVNNAGWGSNAAETSSATQSVGMAGDTATGKKMFNLAKLIWIIIWIPIALIIASVAALIHVNKKSFLNEPENAAAKKSRSGGSKPKSGSHTYKAGGRKPAPRKKPAKKNIYRPHD